MTKLSEHAKSILRAILDGKQVEVERDPAYEATQYIEASTNQALTLISINQAQFLRIKPETRSINGVTFLAPVGSDIGGFCFDARQYDKLKSIAVWESLEARNTAFSAIIDALNGVTK